MVIPGPSKSRCRPWRAHTRFSFVECASHARQDLLDPRGANVFFLSRFQFEYRCTNKNERAQWDTLTRAKNRIIEFMWAPEVQVGVQFAAVKFLQRVILVQSRGIADPRVSVIFACPLQTNDVCLFLLLPSSPFKSCKTKMTQTFRMSPETTHLSTPPLSKPKASLSCNV